MKLAEEGILLYKRLYTIDYQLKNRHLAGFYDLVIYLLI